MEAFIKQIKQLCNKLPPDTGLALGFLSGCIMFGHEIDCALTEASEEIVKASVRRWANFQGCDISADLYFVQTGVSRLTPCPALASSPGLLPSHHTPGVKGYDNRRAGFQGHASIAEIQRPCQVAGDLMLSESVRSNAVCQCLSTCPETRSRPSAGSMSITHAK